MKVIAIDNLSQGEKRNIAPFFDNKNFKFLKIDVRDEQLIKKIKDEKIDYIVHLAAFKIPRYSDSMDTLMVNSEGTKNMLEIAKNKKAKFVFASTSDVYGKNKELPFREDSNLVLGPSTVKRWAYASSKIFDEHMCFAYGERYGVESVILRFFGGYGPNQNLTWWGGPQSVFIECALKNISIPLHGNGKQTRSFTYISDTVEGIYRAMTKNLGGVEIFNIGNNREITIKELGEMIWKKIRGSKPKFNFIPYDKLSKGYQDVERRIPDISKAFKILGFKALIPLEKGLIPTIEWQRRFVK
ncbi:nucleoside-diphosphate-sugar epimerase [Candidatus Omnitrophus magneticus]|uniref:UDP-glucuronate decarboxylase n=1 Tax=Candidatus Omnitrophus magneticus TaxID=1609969 RepID=A0A0F0CM45_9BACT|nr:nucleoside-diphosphate-sugar epimerase [Candidatus Omnitrophus magneticus]